MKLRELLAFAAKYRATGLQLAVGGAMEMTIAGEARRINLPPLQAKDFDELVVQNLTPAAREALRTTGKCEESFEVEGLGRFEVVVEAQKARYVVPARPSPDAGSDRAPGAVPTFSERLRDWFGGKS